MMHNSDVYFDCVSFLNEEAATLDDREFEDWLDMLDEDIEYIAPLRETKEATEESFSDEAFIFNENKETLQMRVERFRTQYAWADTPPARTRRIVGNVRPEENESESINVKSNLILRIGERDEPDTTGLLSCERQDTLRRDNQSLKLSRREIYLDETTFDRNLPLFF